MISNVVARRYAEALFSLAKENNAEMQSIGASLNLLNQMLEDSSEGQKLNLVLRSPTINSEEKKSLIKALLKEIQATNKTLENFCSLLADKNRLEFLSGITFCYNNLLDEALGIVRASVCTAIPMQADEQADLKDRLEKQLAKKLELSFCNDPAILGGLIVKFGDTELDASLRASLNGLRESIKRGE